MNVQGVMQMTLPEWILIVKAWNKAHSTEPEVSFPTEAEFDAMMKQFGGQ